MADTQQAAHPGKRARTEEDHATLQARSSTTEVAIGGAKAEQITDAALLENALPEDPAKLRSMVLSLRQHVKAYQQHLVEMQQQYHKLSEASDATMHEHTLLKRQVAQLSEKSAALMAEFKVQAEQVVAQRAHLQQWEAELRQQEEVLRATKSSGSKKKQAKLQRALALATGSTTNADADLLLTRFKSLIQNAQTLATTAAPSNPPSTQHMMHASTISSNTMRREGSNVSVGRRGSHSSTELLLQQMLHGMSDQRTDDAAPNANQNPPASAMVALASLLGGQQGGGQAQEAPGPQAAGHEQSARSITFPTPSWLKTGQDPMRTGKAAAAAAAAGGAVASTAPPSATQPTSAAGDMLQALALHEQIQAAMADPNASKTLAAYLASQLPHSGGKQ